jgi:hypothetical protein
MNLKKTILASLLLAIGLILHYIIPGTLGSMKPDTFLSMMFIAILLCDNYKLTVLIGLTSGFLTALTTTFPGGQVPNIIDKLITAHAVYFILLSIKNRFSNSVKIVVLSAIGTIISGSVFLSSASVLYGLPAPFSLLFIGVVLPAVIANTILAAVAYNAISASLKGISFKFN